MKSVHFPLPNFFQMEFRLEVDAYVTYVQLQKKSVLFKKGVYPENWHVVLSH